MPGHVTYWREGDPVQNLGDYLSELFLQRVAAVPPTKYARIRLVGSVISDFIIKNELGAQFADPTALVGYWGCGLREGHAVRSELKARCRFHGVRGPLTRNLLGLPADTPIGDPALLLPLLHTPRPMPALSGKAICVPHINDTASDRTLMSLTGADAVVRAGIPRSIEAMLESIDMICAADFTLAGALHAAIIACAYRRPFAYYGGSFVDLPFKWLDFSGSVNIPTVFARTVEEGRIAWNALINRTLVRPKLLPILEVFPGDLRPGLLQKAKAADEG